MPKTKTLDERLREAAAAGELTHFSLVPVAGKGRDGIVFAASYSPASKWGHGHARDADPVKAGLAAFDAVKVKLPRAKIEPEPDPAADDDFLR